MNSWSNSSTNIFMLNLIGIRGHMMNSWTNSTHEFNEITKPTKINGFTVIIYKNLPTVCKMLYGVYF